MRAINSRQLLRPCAPATLISAAADSRRGIYMTPQSNDLIRIADERGYESPLWIAAEDDRWWYSRLTAPKASAKPIKVLLPKRLELFNEDQLKSPISDSPAAVHTSFSSQKPYKGPMLKELDQRALLNDYASKWWITPNVVRQRNLFLKPRMRPHVMLIRVPTDVLHVTDFEEPKALLQQPFAGDTGRPLSGDVGITLSSAMNDRGGKHQAPVWFSTAALGDMDLHPASGAHAVTSLSSEINTFYNLESFERAEELKKAAPSDYAAEASKPRYLTTGTFITSPHVVDALSNSGHHESLWMTSKDLEFKQRSAADLYKLKPNAPSVSVPAFSTNWIFIDDLQDPAAGLKAVGMQTR